MKKKKPKNKNLGSCHRFDIYIHIFSVQNLSCFHVANFVVADGKISYSCLTLPENFCTLFVLCFEVTHPNTNPAQHGLTSVKFCVTKLLEAQSELSNLGWLGNLKMINISASKPMFLDSVLLSSIFLGVMSSQGAIYIRHLPWHYNDIWYQNNNYHATVLLKDK